MKNLTLLNQIIFFQRQIVEALEKSSSLIPNCLIK